MGFSLGSLFKKKAGGSTAGPSLGLMYRRGVTHQDVIKHKPKEVSLPKIIQKHLANYQQLIPEKTIKEAATQFKGTILENEATNILKGEKKISPQQAKTILKQLREAGIIKTTKDLTKVVDDYVYQAGARQAYLIKRHKESVAEGVKSETDINQLNNTKKPALKPKLPPLAYGTFATTTQPDSNPNPPPLPPLTLVSAKTTKLQPTSRLELIKITANGFSPKSIIIYQGTTVQWQNNDSGPHHLLADPHPIHTDLPNFDSRILNAGQTYDFTFDQSGVFTYHDELNLQNRGTIIVK